MSGIFNPKQKLNPVEDKSATLGFEPASKNVIYIKPGHCPQCLKPIWDKGLRLEVIKVYTKRGIDYWCKKCFEKGIKEKTCIKYRSLSKKERKFIKKNYKFNSFI